MKAFLNFFAGLICLLAASMLPLPAAEVTVSAAASLTDALKQVATTYEKNSDDKIIFNFGASSTLARQIEEGAPADVFFSADEAQMNRLDKLGLIDPATRKSILGNSLAIVVPNDSVLPIKSASDLTNASVQRLALADTKVVPAGVYARAWLEKLQLWPAVKAKVIPMENVRAALAAVASGNVDAGVVYRTDAAISKKVNIAYQVPRDDGPDISYPMALVKGAQQPAAARKFLDYLSSKEAGQVFKQYGFLLHE